MGGAHYDHVTHRGILSQRFIAQDRTFDFLGTNAVARHVDDVIRTSVQRERAFITSTRVVTLCVSQFAIPTLEVHLGEAVDIALPVIGAQRVTRAPECSCQIRVRLRNHQLAFLTGFSLSPLAHATRVAGFFNNPNLRLNPGQWPGLGVRFQRLEVTPGAREDDAAVLGGPVGINVVRADVLHCELLHRR